MSTQNLIIYKFVELYHILDELSLDLNLQITFIDTESSLKEKVKNLNNYLIVTVTTGSSGSNMHRSVPTSEAVTASDVPKEISITGAINATV